MTDPRPVALVTGASSGIGRASARALARAGFAVVASARDPGSLADLAPDGIAGLRLDVTDDASMQDAVATLLRDRGRIDLLVNNAGYALAGPIETLPMDDLRRQFETNVFGLVRLTQLVLPAMRRRGAGRIVNISSIGGAFSLPGEGAYHATKYAVEAISDALRVEVGQFGIDVVVVRPTGVSTPFMAKLEETIPGDAGGPYARLLDRYRSTFGALTREGTPGVLRPDDVARVVVRAATAPNPRSRYHAGWSGAAIVAARALLPDRAWDALIRRALGLAGPAAARRQRERGTSAIKPSAARSS